MHLTNPEIKITPADFGLKGNVTAMHYQSYFTKKGWLGFIKKEKGSGFLNTSFQELKFNNNKLVTEKGNDFSDGYDKVYLYYDNGRLAEIKFFAQHPYTKETREYQNNIFRYPDANTLEQTNYIGYDRNFSRSTFTIKGNILEEIRYTEIRKSTERKEYNYNDGGSIISEKEYEIYTAMDISGMETDVFPDFLPHTNDKPENYTSENVFQPQETESKYAEGEEFLASDTVYTYDKNNFLIEERYSRHGEEEYILELHNDAHGNPLRIINYEDGEIVDFRKFSYKYDRQGNWVIRKEYEVEEWDGHDVGKHKASLKFIVERKISYL